MQGFRNICTYSPFPTGLSGNFVPFVKLGSGLFCENPSVPLSVQIDPSVFIPRFSSLVQIQHCVFQWISLERNETQAGVVFGEYSRDCGSRTRIWTGNQFRWPAETPPTNTSRELIYKKFVSL